MWHFFWHRKLVRLGAALVVTTLLIFPGLGIDRTEAGGLYLNEFATPSMGAAGAGHRAEFDHGEFRGLPGGNRPRPKPQLGGRGSARGKRVGVHSRCRQADRPRRHPIAAQLGVGHCRRRPRGRRPLGPEGPENGSEDVPGRSRIEGGHFDPS